MSFADYLTLLRLVLVPFFLFFFLRSDYKVAFVLFAVAGFTDLVDGSIARILKRQTRIGALLDPIADKALMVTTVTCLLVLNIVPLWFFLLIVVRDVMILGGLGYLKIKKIEVVLKPVWSSKLATLSNIAMVIFGFLAYLYSNAFGHWFVFFLWTSTVLVFVSGWQYLVIGCNILRQRNAL